MKGRSSISSSGPYVSCHGFDQSLEELLVVTCVVPLKMVEVIAARNLIGREWV